MRGTYHIISLKDFRKLVKDGHVKLNEDTHEYIYHEGMPMYITISEGNMLHDMLGKIRRAFTYDLDIEAELMEDPFLDGVSGEYGQWFIPSWCVVEWLQKRGIL